MNKVGIVVVSWDHQPFTELCLDSIMKFTDPEMVEILVVDNGSKEITKNWLKRQENSGVMSRHPFLLKVIYNENNLGISPALNQGMKWCQERGLDFCFTSNDIVVGKDWLKNLQEGLYKSDLIGGGSPYLGPEATYDDFVNMEFRENYRRNIWLELKKDPTKERLWELVNQIHGGDFDQFTETWSETRKDVPPLFEWFSMVMYLKLSTIEKVGYFDEQFVPSNWEDMDYMVRMNNVDLARVSVTGSYAFHWSNISNRNEFRDRPQEYSNEMTANEKRFHEKWRIFLPPNQRKHGIPDGDKYEPKKVVDFQPWEVSEPQQNRRHNHWYTWQEWDRLNKYTRLLCENCGWFADNAAMKPTCPVCQTEGPKIRLLTGSLKEIEEYTRQNAK